MKFKIIILIVTIIAVSFSVYYVVRSMYGSSSQNTATLEHPINISEIKDAPLKTGGLVEPLPPKDQADTDAMGKIMSQLPLTTSDFTITFDFAKGKFIVIPTSSDVDNNAAFTTWYQNSDYKGIPISRFVIK